MTWVTDQGRAVWLPPRCHAVLPGVGPGANVVVCVRGERGVRTTQIDLGDSDQAQQVVRQINESLGITARQERALLAGCLLGSTLLGGERGQPIAGDWGLDRAASRNVH